MNALEIIILVIESLNVLATAIFLVFFIKRLCVLSDMSVTNKFIDKHWVIRVTLAILYIAISAAMLGIEFAKYVTPQNWMKELLMSGSVGFCINSLILMVHIAVISQQLRKEVPYSSLHQMFLIYMVLISCLRLGIVTYEFFTVPDRDGFQTLLFCLAILLSTASIFMLVYWIKKKKSMPAFVDFSKVDINTITQKIANPLLAFDHGSIYPQKSSIQRINLIIPNITVQLGKVRIILQMMAEDQVLKSLAQQSTKQVVTNTLQLDEPVHIKSMTLSSKMKSQQHLQIISDCHYTMNQIKSMYLLCAQFDIDAQIKFDDVSMADFYRQVKKFMEELFTIKQSYIKPILQLFNIDKKTIQEIGIKIQKSSNKADGSQLLVSKYVDMNALFLSVQIFKNLWVGDHFIFYIHAISMDHHKESVVTYKRYSDFQEFHAKLQQSVTAEHKGQYKVVPLPKKHFFSWSYGDTDKAVQRRKQLQRYCKQTFNDYTIMTKMPATKQLIFNFLCLKKTFDINPNLKKTVQFYDGLEIKRGHIYKALVDEDYVTFYEFQLFRNGIMIRNIVKRFRDFISLHSSLERWMENQQILYKFIVLPEKHLYKSQSKRHEKLISYLQNTLSIKQVHKIYAVNNFFQIGHRQDIDNSGFGMSMIKRQGSLSDSGQQAQTDRPLRNQKKLRDHQSIDPRKNHDFSMESEKQRMSLLIEQLGGDD